MEETLAPDAAREPNLRPRGGGLQGAAARWWQRKRDSAAVVLPAGALESGSRLSKTKRPTPHHNPKHTRDPASATHTQEYTTPAN